MMSVLLDLILLSVQQKQVNSPYIGKTDHLLNEIFQ